jgi:hypothetical protein
MKRIELDETEKALLANHSPSVMHRAIIELDVVNALVQAAKDAGYRLGVEGYDDETIGEDIRTLLFDLDEVFVLVFSGRKAIGWVRLAFGNGWDMVSDYTTNLEDFLAPVNAVAESWEKGY